MDEREVNHPPRDPGPGPVVTIGRARGQVRRESAAWTAAGALLVGAVAVVVVAPRGVGAWLATAAGIVAGALVLHLVHRRAASVRRVRLHPGIVESEGPGGHWAVPWSAVTAVEVVTSRWGRSVELVGPDLRLAAPRTFPGSDDPDFDAKVRVLRTARDAPAPAVPAAVDLPPSVLRR